MRQLSESDQGDPEPEGSNAATSALAKSPIMTEAASVPWITAYMAATIGTIKRAGPCLDSRSSAWRCSSSRFWGPVAGNAEVKVNV